MTGREERLLLAPRLSLGEPDPTARGLYPGFFPPDFPPDFAPFAPPPFAPAPFFAPPPFPSIFPHVSRRPTVRWNAGAPSFARTGSLQK